MSFGQRVRRRRERLGFTQEDLAQKTGIQQTLISRIERGANQNPHGDVLKRLALALHVSIDWLMGMYDDDPHDQASSLVLSASP